MFSSLSEEIQAELKQLAQRYGAPLVHREHLKSTNQFDPLRKTDRYGEVCMVVRRPNGRLLTMKKTFYPPETFRLLTGGIHHGENIFDALLRETYEETGLQTELQRFLAVVAYYTSNSNEIPSFFTFAFLLDEVGGTLDAIDEGEKVEAFKEIRPDELPAQAAYLADQDDQFSTYLNGNLADWGRFRAVIHRVVWEALKR